jgi:hypothetical protein
VVLDAIIAVIVDVDEASVVVLVVVVTSTHAMIPTVTYCEIKLRVLDYAARCQEEKRSYGLYLKNGICEHGYLKDARLPKEGIVSFCSFS